MVTNSKASTFDELFAIEQIKQLKHRYWRVCDSKDPQGFRDCFIRSGAKLDYGALGSYDDVEPIARIFEEVALQKLDDGGWVILEMHHGYMPEISIISETQAQGTWSLQHRRLDRSAGTDTTTVGVYSDRYEIEDGQWKISASSIDPQWSVTRPIDSSTQIS
jgi:hypothetical protein